MAPTPVTGTSWGDHPVLFEAPIMLGDEGTGGGAAVTSGKLPWTILLVATDLGPIVFGTPVLLECKADVISANVPPLPFRPPHLILPPNDHGMTTIRTL